MSETYVMLKDPGEESMPQYIVHPLYIVEFEPGQTGAAGEGEDCEELVSVDELVCPSVSDAELLMVLIDTADEELVEPLTRRIATSAPELIRVPPGDFR